MKKYILSFLLLGFIFQLSAQDLYHRAKIDLQGKHLEDLAVLGIEVDHGHLALGRYLENDYSEKEIQLIRDAGFTVEILIADMESFYANQLEQGLNKAIVEDCFGDATFSTYETPENFTLGSMGGFYTYEEVLAILDDMQAKFPDLISAKKQIGTFETHEGRPIYSIVISDNPEVTEDEPKSFYNSIHHAREPNGLTQLIYYMWYLLENYDNDPMVAQLVNELELHFIPVVNPDGYIYNQVNNPNGGGLWRKNRRDNGDGTFGVDLNRNYGFEWGLNDTGSSPNTDAQTYRGPSAFSEPETQAVKFYCETFPFNFILNYHTFGNLLIYPWGYNDSPTPENDYFRAIAGEMTRLNDYTFGTGIETVGYNVNGDSDDWMYGEQVTKEKSYSMTPEVGTQGFWPGLDDIIPNCQDNMQANLSMAAFNLNYPVISVEAPIFINNTDGLVTYEVNQLGLSPGEFAVTAEALSTNVTVSENTTYNLVSLEKQQKTVEFYVDPATAFGEEVVFVLKTDALTPIPTDTIRFKYVQNSESEAIVEEVFGDDLFWTADNTNWFYTDEKFVSPAVSFTESVGENYSNNVNKSTTSKYVELPEAEQLLLTFDLFVDTEANYDFVILYIDTDAAAPVPLCGKYSSEGTDDQYLGLPLYDGSFGWVKEEIDITEWKGQNVTFILEFVSDGFVNEDGVYIDDWSISSLNEVSSVEDFAVNTVKIFPNPATDQIKIDMPYENIELIYITNLLGQKVTSMSSKQNILDIQSLNAGIYHVIVVDKDGKNYASQFVKK